MVVPVPVEVSVPWFLVKVQVPDGNPYNTTLPVDIEQVGWVIMPMVGADGAPGAELIVTSGDGAELHPEASVTV